MSENQTSKEKSKELRERLFMKKGSGAGRVSAQSLADAQTYCEGYKHYLDVAKTEREAVAETIRLAKEQGFEEYCEGKVYQPGDRIYKNNRGKAILLAVIGKQPVEKGVHIAAAHLDSPRLDLKPNPLYENDELAYFKTRYYGGIKKYQWTTVPLSLHGVVMLKDGTKVEISIGDNDDEPQFCVTDLLIHLASEQMGKPARDVVAGEQLNILIGSYPLEGDEDSDSVKLNILRILNEKYGIVEADFVSAELEAVPAMKARDVGFDRSMIGAYGHDDLVCAYPSLTALFDTKQPEYTAICCLADKEEIGSDGNTGLNAAYLEYFVHDLAEMQGGNGRRALSHSKCLSADVNAAYDPNFSGSFDKRNCSFINGGAALTKYTGGRGKGGSSDASAETVSYFRRMLDNNDVLWQIGELGKVEAGGGGTVALYIANLDVDVLDIGVPVLSMHAPWEIVSKLDVYMTHRAIYTFYTDEQ